MEGVPLKTYDFTNNNSTDNILIENHLFNIYVSQIEFKGQTDYISEVTGSLFNEFAKLKIDYEEICSKHNILANVYKELVNKVKIIEKKIIKLEQVNELTKEMTDLTFDMPEEK